jgi:hypothetical protein
MDIWHISKLFGIFFTILVSCRKKNLATLHPIGLGNGNAFNSHEWICGRKKGISVRLDRGTDVIISKNTIVAKNWQKLAKIWQFLLELLQKLNHSISF